MNPLSIFIGNLRRLNDDERGAESSEIILALVLLVIGLIAAWTLFKDKLIGQLGRTGDCIENAANASCN